MTVLKLKILVSKSNALIKRKLVDRVRFRFVRVFRFGRLIKSRFDTIEPLSSDSTPILPPSVFLILEFLLEFSWIYLNEIETDEDKILKLIETSLEAPALIKTRTLFFWNWNLNWPQIEQPGSHRANQTNSWYPAWHHHHHEHHDW